ncbi:helix-turn-helix domain-containing protein [Pantoea sp. JGM49]|uniref:LPD7 domain-containing protein n=1 Tax=Pantoea sp. JGM49 TaxID=2799791 RepID=UPI001BAB2AAE|nr:LPD7 domain-containing protein [Pantoea sp. JGM49]MBS0883170.1 helix-turn-helix domain-containing protein [Pantoea sp. JGM49]
MKTADYPVWLAVMPDQRDAARADAGKHPKGGNAITWDKEAQLWYARPGADLSRLQAWLPDPSRRSGGGDPQTEFLDALTDAGLIIDGLPVMDGEIHRVSVTDGPKGNGDGVYRGFLNGSKPGGWFINYWTAKTHKDITKWKGTGGESDPVARLHMKAVARQSRDDSARRLADTHARQTAKAKALYERLPPADPEHPYLQRKGVTADDGIRQTRNGALVIPFQDVDGAFRTLQYIPPDGEKYLFSEAPKAGHFRVVGGALTGGEPILYAEGYATARSLNEVTGRPVVMTIDAGNMLNVANVLSARYPESPHLFMVDFDHSKPVNTGLVMGEQAALNTGGKVIIPDFTAAERDAGLTDFNDVHQSRGTEALRADLLPQINQALAGLHYKENVMATPDDAQPAPDNVPAASPDATPARRPGAAREKTDEILKLRDEGLKPAQIAEQLGIGQTSVYRILKAQQPEAAPVTPPAPAAGDVPASRANDLAPAASAPVRDTITLYHGSPAAFSAVDPEKIGLGQNFMGRGFYTDNSVTGVQYAMEEINHPDYHVYELEIPSHSVILDRWDSSTLTDALRDRIREAGKTVDQALTAKGETSRLGYGDLLAGCEKIDATFFQYAGSPEGMRILKEAGIDALKDNSYVAIVNTDLIDNVRLRSAEGASRAEMAQYIERASGHAAQDASRLSEILQEKPGVSVHYDAIRSELVSLASAQNRPEEAERLTALLRHTLVETADNPPDRKTAITPLNRLYAEAVRSLDLTQDNHAARLGQLVDSAVSNMNPEQKPAAEPVKPEPETPEPVAAVQDSPAPDAPQAAPAAFPEIAAASEPVVPAATEAEAPAVADPQPAPATPVAAPAADADILRAPPVIQGELRGALSALIQGSITPAAFQDTSDRLQRELNQVRESGTYNDAYVSETQAVFDRLTGDGLAVSERPGMFSRALSAAGLKDSDTTLSLRSSGQSDVRTIPAQIQSLYTRLADGELSRPQLEKALREVRNDLRRAELSGQQSAADVQSSWAAFGRLDLAAGETEGRAVTAAVAALAASRVSAAAPAEAAPAVADIPAPAVQPEQTVTPDVSFASPETPKPAQDVPASEAAPAAPAAAAVVMPVPEPAVAEPAAAVADSEPALNVPEVQPAEASPALSTDAEQSAGTEQPASAASATAEFPDFSAGFANISERLRALKDEAASLDTDVLAMRTGALINERIALTEMWSQGHDTQGARWPSEEGEALEAELRAELEKRPGAAPSPLAAASGEENAILVDAPRVAPQDEDAPGSSGPNASRIDADRLLSRITHEKQPDGQSVLYRLDGEPAFIDRGNRLVMAEGTSAHEEMVLAALLTAANHYHGRIELTGSDEFKAFAIGVIVANKLDVSMKNASQQADLDAARRAAGQPVMPAAPADAVRGDPQAPRAAEVPPVMPPSPAEQQDISQVQHAIPVTASPQPASERAPEPAAPKVSPAVHTPAEKAREPVTGKVTACGQAPFRFEKDASESTFITLRTKEGPQTFWGKELAGLLRETHLQPGRVVTLQWMGEQPVTVNKPMKDAQGNFSGQYEKVQTRRNQWSLAPAGGSRVQTGAEEMVRLAAVDVNRYQQIQHTLVSRLGLDIDAPPKPADGLYWLKPDGQGSSVPGDPLSAPRPAHNERAGTPVMSAWGADGRPDLLLVQGDGDYLQGIVRQEGVYQHVLVSLPGSAEAPPMVVNLLTPEGARPIGNGNGINRSNGQPVPREHVVVRLTGDAEPRIAKLDAPADVPAALHARLGYDERYKADTAAPKDRPAAAPQAAPVTPPRPA